MVDRTFLADLDGNLCVVWESSHSIEPKLVRHYWQTQSSPGVVLRTRDFLSYYDCEGAKLELMPVRRSIPGEYFVQVSSDAHNGRNCYLTLIEGSKTKSCKLELLPFPAPKTKLETKYTNGSWLVLLNGNWKIRA